MDENPTPMTSMEVIDAKLNKVISKTAMLEQDGDTLWDRVDVIRKDNKSLNIKMDQALTLLQAKPTLSVTRASALIFGGSVFGGGIVALILGLALIHWGGQLIAMAAP